MTTAPEQVELAPPPATFIRLDLFPAILTPLADSPPLPNQQPGAVLDAKRIIATDQYFLLFSDTVTGPKLEHVWTLVDFQGRNTTGWTVHTEEGYNFLVRRSNGCGCGTKLRSIFPYLGVPYQPTV